MNKICLPLIVLATFLNIAYSVDPPRVWTDVKGRQIEARLISWDKEAGLVKVEMKSRVRHIKFETLSERDQTHVTENAERAGILRLGARSKTWGMQKAVEIEIHAVNTERVIAVEIYFTGTKQPTKALSRIVTVEKGDRKKFSLRSNASPNNIYQEIRTETRPDEVAGWVVVFREDSLEGEVIEIEESLHGERNKVLTLPQS